MSKELSDTFPKKHPTTTDQSSRLQKLLQQQEKINKQIALAKAREKGQERKKDTRRKILIGATLRTEAETDTALYDKINHLLDRYLTRPDDRKLFSDIPPEHRKEKSEKATT